MLSRRLRERLKRINNLKAKKKTEPPKKSVEISPKIDIEIGIVDLK